jgi:hypothetical protein
MRSSLSSSQAHAIIHRGISPLHVNGGAVMQFTDELPDEEEMDYMGDLEAGTAGEQEAFESMKLGGFVELGHLSAPVQFSILAL